MNFGCSIIFVAAVLVNFSVAFPKKTQINNSAIPSTTTTTTESSSTDSSTVAAAPSLWYESWWFVWIVAWLFVVLIFVGAAAYVYIKQQTRRSSRSSSSSLSTCDDAKGINVDDNVIPHPITTKSKFDSNVKLVKKTETFSRMSKAKLKSSDIEKGDTNLKKKIKREAPQNHQQIEDEENRMEEESEEEEYAFGETSFIV